VACRASLTWEAAEVTTNDGGANAKPAASDPREPFFGDQGFLLWQGATLPLSPLTFAAIRDRTSKPSVGIGVGRDLAKSLNYLNLRANSKPNGAQERTRTFTACTAGT
jgi:hypothetical protein